MNKQYRGLRLWSRKTVISAKHILHLQFVLQILNLNGEFDGRGAVLLHNNLNNIRLGALRE